MERKFFAASNSCDGFKNYYGECFERADRLYIIKGGPGTGKSTFMKVVGNMAQGEGYYTEHYCCSSDYTSYDGVLFKKGGEYIGLIDGTFPHPYIEKLPGVREEILNLGVFWNSDILRSNGDTIRELSANKTRCYNNAYSYLRTCGNLREVLNSYISGKINTEKIEKEVEKLTRDVPRGSKFSCIPTPVNSIGMLGKSHFDTYEAIADKIYMLCGESGAGELLCGIFKCAQEKEHKIRSAPNPVYFGEFDGVYLEDARIWFVREDALSDKAIDEYQSKIKRINMQRFELEGASEWKSEKRYCKKLIDEAMNAAEESLRAAGEYHFEIEKIYKSAMDFSGVNDYVNEFCQKII